RVTVEPGRCTAIAAVAGRGLGRLELMAHDASGELVARGVMRNAAAIAVVCPPAREGLVLHVRAAVGSGDAAVQRFVGPPPPAWATGVDRVAISEALSTQVATLEGGWRAEGTPERLRLGARAVRAREVGLLPGTCTRFVVSAGRGLPGVALALGNTGGQV